MVRRVNARNHLKKVILLFLIVCVCAAVIIAKKASQTPESGPEIKVYFHNLKRTKTIPLEQYVTGVVMAEMPASFEIEALKAQAVCARSYALTRAYGASSHPEGAHVCDDPSHCQGYVDPETVTNPWKVNRIKTAVAATRGQVLTCCGQLATTYFHSCCGGKTASAAEVWGRKVPYLTGVICPCPEISPYQNQEYAFSVDQVLHRVGINFLLIPRKIKIVEYASSGRVSKIGIGSDVITGAAFRRALNLPSTWFTLAQSGSRVIIRCRGYGHGVGMCQYGANRLAQKGYSYRAILYHYFPGTELWSLAY